MNSCQRLYYKKTKARNFVASSDVKYNYKHKFTDKNYQRFWKRKR